jgi:protein-tyrosine-phosphatase
MGIEDRADHLRHQINDDLLLWRQEERIPLEAYTPLGTIARRFERVTDQSKNICEEILYMCTGEFLKHKGADAFRVLFVDADNACLSQMAEALGRSLNLPRIVFTSAGLAPTEVAPEMVRFLSDKGLAVGPGTTQALDQVQDREHYQVMVALAESCRKAFPPRPTKTVCLVWPLADPRTVSGSAAQVHAAFEEAYRFLDRHIRDLVEALQGAQESTPSL